MMFNEIISCQKAGQESGEKTITRKGRISWFILNPGFRGLGRYGVVIYSL